MKCTTYTFILYIYTEYKIKRNTNKQIYQATIRHRNSELKRRSRHKPSIVRYRTFFALSLFIRIKCHHSHYFHLDLSNVRQKNIHVCVRVRVQCTCTYDDFEYHQANGIVSFSIWPILHCDGGGGGDDSVVVAVW